MHKGIEPERNTFIGIKQKSFAIYNRLESGLKVHRQSPLASQ